MAPPGKIQALPHGLRQDINMRLLDGQSSTEILPWLNGLAEVREVLANRFEGVEVSDQNLSNWRMGPYQDWLRKREKEESIKSLAEFSSRLARAAGGNMTAGAQAVATGKVLELLESSAYEEENLPDLIGALTKLRTTDLRQHEINQRSRALDLAENKFQVSTCELFLKWYDDAEAKRIASGKEERTVKIEQLRLKMFGNNPYETE